MLAGQLEIQLMASVARLSKDMDDAKRSVGGAMANIERSVGTAKAALGSLGLGLGLAQVIAITDQYVKFGAQLKLAARSASEYSTALSDVRRISTLAQSEIAATGVLYARITNATRELGISQIKVSEITEVASLALKSSGATSAEAASAMLQLSQAFGSGVLRGQEFNAVNEAAPRLMKALAEGIGVPVGQLRSMAEAGKLTSEVMAGALPRALAELRNEAAQVQTIAGAFQVLKNNVMEFVGASAQSSGSVRVLTSGIGVLAENLQLILGVITTIAAAKFAAWLATGTAALYAQVAASRAAAAAALVKAQADATATAATVALTAARVAELRAAVVAAEGNVALAITMDGLVPMQSRAAAAATAHTASLTALAAAQRAASVSAGVAGGALALLGGPVGAAITLLGVAATAWAVWGSAAKDANDKASKAVNATGPEIDAMLDSQISKLRERIALAKAGEVQLAKDGGEAAELQARRLQEINDLKAKGAALTLVDQVQLLTLEGIYESTARRVNQLGVETAALSAIGEQSKAAEWAEKYATKAEKLAAELEKYRKEVGAAFDPKIAAQIAAKFKETDKLSTAYAAVQKHAADYIKALEKEGQQLGLTAIQQKMVEAALEAMKLKTEAERKAVMAAAGAWAIKRTALDDATEAIAKAMKAEDDYAARLNAAEDAQFDATTTLAQKVQAINDETYALAATAEQLRELHVLRELEQSGLDRSSEAWKEYGERLRDAMSARDLAKANKDAAEETNRTWKKVTDDVNRALTDAVMNGGKGGLENLKNYAKAFVVRVGVEYFTASVGGALGVPGASAAGGSSGVGGLSSFASPGNSVGYGIANGAQWLSSGSAMGPAAPGSMGSFFAGAGQYSNLQYGIAGIGGGLLGGAIGGETGATLGSIGASIGMAAGGPLGAAVGSVLGGMAGSLFGDDDDRVASVQAQSLKGSIGQGGFSGDVQSFLGSSPTDWWGGSSLAPFSATAEAAIDKSVTAVFEGMLDLARRGGFDTAGAAGISVELPGETGKGIEADLGAAMTTLADTLATKLMPNVAQFQAAGESLAATFARVANARAQWQQQIDLLTGVTTQQAIDRAGELASTTDETTLALIRQVHAQQDLATAVESALRSTDTALASLSRAVDAERGIITAAYEASSDELTAALDGIIARVGKLSTFAGSLRGTVDTLRPLAFAEARAQIDTALAISRAGGPLPMDGSLTRALQSITQNDAAQYATAQDYARDQARAAASVSDLADIADDQLTAAEISQRATEDQLELLGRLYDGEMTRLDAIMTSAQTQIDVLKGIDTSVLSVADAVRALNVAAASVGNAERGLTTSAGGATYSAASDTWTSADGMHSGSTAAVRDVIQSFVDAGDAAGLYYGAKAAGLSLSDIDTIYGAPAGSAAAGAAALGLPQYAVGTNYMIEDGPIYAHKGETWKPAVYVDIERAAREEMTALTRRLVESNESMKKELADIKRDMKRTADITEKSDAIGPAPARAEL